MNSSKVPFSGVPLLAVLFDLDGTLADTAPDLAHALNVVREEQDKHHLPFDEIRPHVSHGATALIQLGFPEHASESDRFGTLRLRLLDVYKNNLTLHTRLFDGMSELLAELEQRDIKWGVITNKPAWLTEPLLDELGLKERAACIVSGDTTTQCKPHPQPMYHACNEINIPPANCLYIGDAQRDIDAGHNAGMRTLVALFGYLGDNDQPEQWQANAMITTPMEALSWLLEQNQI